MLILLAEDDEKISRLLINLLHKDGFEADYASNGRDALTYCEMNHYDVIILDWIMPELSGM